MTNTSSFFIHTLTVLPRRKLYLAVAAQFMLNAAVHAAPSGGAVIGGTGQIDQVGKQTTIRQETNTLAIDWQTFDVAADEVVRFVQPDKDAVALNRILDHDASHIFGRVEANGQLILMNPNGVFFGETATIDVGGLVASGLAIDPEEFINGDFTLDAVDSTSGFVVNQGIINASTGGSVVLVGKKVHNEGLITAQLGRVSLAAGKQAVLTFDSAGMLGVKVNEAVLQNELGVDAAVRNDGRIESEGGKVLLTGSASQDVFSQAVNSGELRSDTSVVMHEDGSFTLGGGADVVNSGSISVAADHEAGDVVLLGENVRHSGLINADSVDGEAGHVELHARDTLAVSEGGEISASASQGDGGDIKMLGRRVGLFDRADVQVNGGNVAGQVLLGGDIQGRNDFIPHADFVYLGPNTATKANGSNIGNGGKIVVYADDTARIYGRLSAAGAENGGNAGFVETSGRKGFDITAVPDVSASHGKSGEWLIDPYDLTITDSVTIDIGTEVDPFSAAGPNAVLDVDLVTEALNAGSDVFISTGDEGAEEGNITLDAPILYSGSGTSRLTLSAANDVRLNADIDARGASGGLAVTLRADASNDDQGLVSTDNIGIFTNGMSLSVSGYDIDFSNTQFSVTNDSDNAGLVSLNADNQVTLGAVDFRGEGGDYVTGAAIDIVAPGGADLLGSVYTNSGRLNVNVQNSGAGIRFADGMVIDTRSYSGTASNEGAVQLTAGAELTLPDIFTNESKGAYAPIIADSIDQSVIVNGQLIAGSGLSLYAGEDVRLNGGSVIDVLAGDGAIGVDAGDVIYFRASSPDNPLGSDSLVLPELDAHGDENHVDLVLGAGSGIVIDSNIYLAGGDFVAYSGGGSGSGFSSDLILSDRGPGITADIIATQGHVYLRGQNYVGVRGIGKQSGSQAEPDRRANGLSIESGGEVLLGAGSISVSGDITISVSSDAVQNSLELPIDGTGSVNIPDMIADPNYSQDSLSLNFNFGAGDRTIKTHGGSVYIEGDQSIQFVTHYTMDTSSESGHGEIAIYAGGDLKAPRVLYSSTQNLGIAQTASIDFEAGGDLVWFVDLDTNNTNYQDQALELNLSAGNDLYLGVVAEDPQYPSGFFDIWPESSLGYLFSDSNSSVQDAFHLNASAGNKLIQNSKIYTGGGDVVFSAAEFAFSDNALLNTNSLNETSNALNGSGNITLQSRSSFTLPDIVTQSDCAQLPCGNVSIQTFEDDAAIDVRSDRTFFDIGGDLNVSIGEGVFLLDENGLTDSRRIGGALNLMDVGSANIALSSPVDLGVVNVEENLTLRSAPENTEESHIIADEPLSVGGNLSLSTARIGTASFGGYVDLSEAENSVGGALSVVSGTANIAMSGDLALGTMVLSGEEGAAASEIVVSGSIFQSENSGIYGSVPSSSGETVSTAPIAFRAGGDITLDQADNHFSSLVVDDAQNVTLSSSSALDIGGIVADSLTLNAENNVIQSGDLIIAGRTSINAANNNFSIELGRASNQLNELAINGNFTTIGGIRVDESDGMVVQDIYTKGTLSLTTHDAGSSITQRGDWLVDNSGGSGVVMNLTTEELELGNAGENSLQLAGAALNATGWQRLLIDGAVGGSEADQTLEALLHISGRGDPDATLSIGENAVFPNVRSDSYITLGAGNDTVEIAANVPFKIDLGNGDDTVYQLAPYINAEVHAHIGSDAFYRFAGEEALWSVGSEGTSTVQIRNQNIDGGYESAVVLKDFEVYRGANEALDHFILTTVDQSEITLDGGLGENILTALGVDNQVVISGEFSGDVNSSIQFESIQVINTAEGNDQIILQADGVMGDINTGAGDDSVELMGAAALNNIYTGSGSDRVQLSENSTVRGWIDAGSDDVDAEGIGTTDILDLTATITQYELNFLTGEANVVSNISGFERTLYNESGFALFGGDGEITWTFDDENRLTLSGEGLQQTFDDVSRVRGGAGANEFIFSENGSFAGLIEGSAEGQNTIYGNADMTEWLFSGDFSGSVVHSTTGDTLHFSQVSEIYGGEGNDNFLVERIGVIGSIYGGLGNDSLHLTEGAQITEFVGGDDSDSLYGADKINLWNLSGEASGVLVDGVQFQSVETLYGGVEDDSFVVFNTVTSTELGTVLFGGDGNDQITGPDSTDNTWDLSGSTLNDAIQFSEIELLNGGTGGSSNRLIAPNTDNDWRVDSDYGGSLNNGAIRFTGMNELQGGTGVDTFTVADGVVVGSILGGDGSDVISIGNDVVFGDSSLPAAMTLDGQGGDDTIVLGDRIVMGDLIGGAGNDTISLGRNVSLTNVAMADGADRIILSPGLSVSGVVDGGAGEDDILDVTAYQRESSVIDLAEFLGFSFVNFSEVLDSLPENVFVGSNGTNYWFITGHNSGVLRSVEEGEDRETVFTDVTSLQGGTGEDYFIFANDSAAISDSIDGGAGENTLALSWDDNGEPLVQNLINDWLIDGVNSGVLQNANNETGNVFANISVLIGGGNRDVFSLLGNSSIASLNGGDGSDTIVSESADASEWSITSQDAGNWQDDVEFASIENLLGSAAQDNFVISAGAGVSGLLDGGEGTVDWLRHQGTENEWRLSLTEQDGVLLVSGQVASTRFQNIERWVADGTDDTLVGADLDSRWNLGQNIDTRYVDLDNVSAYRVNFTGMENIIGGNADDQFVAQNGANLPSVIYGGPGEDVLDLQSLATNINVGVTADEDISEDGVVAVNLDGVEQVLANAQQRTVIFGGSDQSYTWTLDGARSGTLAATSQENQSLLAFDNISAIRGGRHDDFFRVLTENTLVSLDGGDAQSADFVDYSGVNANLKISLAHALSGQSGEIAGVEGIRGNNSGVGSLNTAELIGGNNATEWTALGPSSEGLVDGVNDGEVSDGVTAVRFIDFNILTGGSADDVFNLADGVITGVLRGAAGNDRFNMAINGAEGRTEIVGGEGQDNLVLSGADRQTMVTASSDTEGSWLRYDAADTWYQVSYSELEVVQENSFASTLEIQGTPLSDTIALGNGQFQVNDAIPVTYRNKNDLAVRVAANDFIEIRDNLAVDGSLALFNGRVFTLDSENTSISASELVFDSTGDVGTVVSAPIRTSIDRLRVRNAVGDIALQEQNNLEVAEFVSGGEFDLLLLNGDLTNAGAVTTTDDFRVTARAGNVSLTQENRISGAVSFTVSGDVLWQNSAPMTIAALTANNMLLIGERGVEASGVVTVPGDSVLQATGDIAMENPLNDFNRVSVTDARNVSLVDQNQLQLVSANTRGYLWVDALGIGVLQNVIADSIRLDANDAVATIDGDLRTDNGDDIEIFAGIILQNGDLVSGRDTRLDGESITQSGSINSRGDVQISAGGGDVLVAEGSSTRGQQVVIEASGSLQVQDIEAESVSLSGGQLVVTGGSLHATEGDINVQSGSYQMSVASILEADRGSITIVAQDNVQADSSMTGTSVAISGNEVTLNGEVKATQGGVSVEGAGRVDVNQGVNASNGVTISAENGTVTQGGSIAAASGSVNVSAGGSGDVVMSSESKIKVSNGDVSISAGRDVVIADVASSGKVSLDAAGEIVDANADEANVSAGRLVSNSGRGVGQSDGLETRVQELEVVASSGDVAISNQGSVDVSKLQTDGGNVTLNNDGDIALQGGAVKAKNPGASGEVVLNASKGNITQQGSSAPAVDSDAITVIAEGGQVGGGERDLVIASKDVTIYAQTQGGTILTPNDPDSKIVFSGSYKFEDHLLAIEPLEDVDPAVFNNVRTYFHNDVSLRLPADQLFEEDDEEEGEAYGYVE